MASSVVGVIVGSVITWFIRGWRVDERIEKAVVITSKLAVIYHPVERGSHHVGGIPGRGLEPVLKHPVGDFTGGQAVLVPAKNDLNCFLRGLP